MELSYKYDTSTSKDILGCEETIVDTAKLDPFRKAVTAEPPKRPLEWVKQSPPPLVISGNDEIEPRFSTLPYARDGMPPTHVQQEVVSKSDWSSDCNSPGADFKATAEASKQSSPCHSNSNCLFGLHSSGNSDIDRFDDIDDTENMYMFKLDPSEQSFDQHSDCPDSPCIRMKDDLTYLLQESEVPIKKSHKNSLVDVDEKASDIPIKYKSQKSMGSISLDDSIPLKKGANSQ